MDTFLADCANAVLQGDKSQAMSLASSALEQNANLLDVIEHGFSQGIRQAGELWEKGEYFLPELAFSAEAMKAAMEVLQPALLEGKAESRSRGKVVIGTIQGDIHDIGKTLVSTMLSANGFSVVDLGADVAYAKFVEDASKQKAQLVCMSALLTTTMSGQGQVIRLLKEKGLRDKVKVLVGGAPTNASWAEEIGADGYAENAVAAVQMAASLLS
ncbi:MAG: corrinoid protein [Candidatus Latescibacterota bacterium]